MAWLGFFILCHFSYHLVLRPVIKSGLRCTSSRNLLWVLFWPSYMAADRLKDKQLRQLCCMIYKLLVWGANQPCVRPKLCWLTSEERTQWIRFFFPFSSSRFESRHTVTLLFTERSIYKLKHELFNNLRITRPKMTSSIKPLTKISGTKNIFIFKGFLSAKLWCTRHGYRCSNSKFLFFIKHQYLISQNRVIR